MLQYISGVILLHKRERGYNPPPTRGARQRPHHRCPVARNPTRFRLWVASCRGPSYQIDLLEEFVPVARPPDGPGDGAPALGVRRLQPAHDARQRRPRYPRPTRNLGLRAPLLADEADPQLPPDHERSPLSASPPQAFGNILSRQMRHHPFTLSAGMRFSAPPRLIQFTCSHVTSPRCCGVRNNSRSSILLPMSFPFVSVTQHSAGAAAELAPSVEHRFLPLRLRA